MGKSTKNTVQKSTSLHTVLYYSYTVILSIHRCIGEAEHYTKIMCLGPRHFVLLSFTVSELCSRNREFRNCGYVSMVTKKFWKYDIHNLMNAFYLIPSFIQLSLLVFFTIEKSVFFAFHSNHKYGQIN